LLHGAELWDRKRYWTENRNPASVAEDHLTAKLVVVGPEAGDTTSGTLMVPVMADGPFVEA
jgi:hypothetical protein